jgi:BRCT domain type II-containing protein
MQKKLTLRIDEDLIKHAKSYSKSTGKSISQIVASFFILLGEESPKKISKITPLVRSIKGSLKGKKIDEEDYKQYIEDKYL